MTKRLWLIAILMTLVVLTGCELFAGKETVPPPTVEPETIIFEDDFTDDDVGALPSKWTFTDNLADHSLLQVVVDDGVPSKRAVHFRADINEEQNILAMLSPFFGEKAQNVTTMGIEFWYKHVSSGAIYTYITPGTAHRMIILLGNNRVQNREKGETGNISNTVADLEEGWNRIRVIVNRDTNKIDYYINDMENPIDGDFTTLAPIGTWDELRIRVVHETGSETDYREAYYSGFKVWVVE